mmetsp:Transcript_12790/g.36158  ORF Transcript_12790/g.36158 Transcript_12790/m.36158 type:complete len:299 (+) Transcript_12790:189-1085(+)
MADRAAAAAAAAMGCPGRPGARLPRPGRQPGLGPVRLVRADAAVPGGCLRGRRVARAARGWLRLEGDGLSEHGAPAGPDGDAEHADGPGPVGDAPHDPGDGPQDRGHAQARGARRPDGPARARGAPPGRPARRGPRGTGRREPGPRAAWPDALGQRRPDHPRPGLCAGPAARARGPGQPHHRDDSQHPEQVHAEDAAQPDRRVQLRALQLFLSAHRLQEQVQRGLRVPQPHQAGAHPAPARAAGWQALGPVQQREGVLHRVRQNPGPQRPGLPLPAELAAPRGQTLPAAHFQHAGPGA